MKRVYLIRGALVAVLLLAYPAHAEDSAKQFLAKIDGLNKADAQMYKTVLGAYGTGIQWANTAVEHDGGQPLFCLPDKLVLTDEQEIDMVRRHIKEFPYMADMPAGMTLLMAYRDTFPCKKSE